MSTKTKTRASKAPKSRTASRRCAVVTGSAPTSDQIAKLRTILVRDKLKVRASYKHTINTRTMVVQQWPIIEVWCRQTRRYLPLCVGEVWRYDTDEARDAVLAALQNNKVSERLGENQHG